MNETRKITRQAIEACEIDLSSGGLARFIPERGLEPGEFIRLPIAQYLNEANQDPRRDANLIRLEILLRNPGLGLRLKRKTGLKSAAIALQIFEEMNHESFLPRRVFQALERRIKGELSLEETKELDNEIYRSLHWEYAGLPWNAAYGVYFNLTLSGDGDPELHSIHSTLDAIGDFAFSNILKNEPVDILPAKKTGIINTARHDGAKEIYDFMCAMIDS